jgi:cyclase
MRIKRLIAASLLSAAISTPALAHDHAASAPPAASAGPVMDFDQMTKTFGWDIDKAQIKTQKLADGFYVLFGLGGNIAVSVGKDGTFIVDDQFPQLIPKIKAALEQVGSKKVDFAVNTHWHFDHSQGNLAFGPAGTWIISQNNSRDKMATDNVINFGQMAYGQKAFPESALSDITFDKAMQFHINGEQIDLLHFGAAHTNGDTAVFFRGRNAVHMGDVFNNTGYPFIDVDNGGSLDGVIAFSQAVYDLTDEQTAVIPGHGEVANRAKLGRYIEVLSIIRDRMNVLVAQGKTLEETIAAKPTAEFDTEMMANAFNLPSFLNRTYASIRRDHAPKN